MGTHDLSEEVDAATFVRAALEDLDVLGEMLGSGDWAGSARLGAEQEFMLVDRHLAPAKVAPEVLRRLADDPRFTFEVARWQLELNLTPQRLSGRDAFGLLAAELREATARARAAASKEGASLLLCGLPPTFELCHATPDAITPHPRYRAFDRATLAARGGRLWVTLHGIDSLSAWVDNISAEAAATSFQIHLQVPVRGFSSAFNCALLSAAPLVAACANSPLFAGRRLWHETRIPLLEPLADIRGASRLRRGGLSRTLLSDGWLSGSVIDLLRRDLARYTPVVIPALSESSAQALREGRVPALKALTTFNSAVWRWIRPCYGVTGGRPHLRLENRLLSSGPTLRDEVANAAFWVGLMHALPAEYGDFTDRLSFAEADANLHEAARRGLDAELTWLDGERVPVRTLLLFHLLPMARAGLQALELTGDTATAALDDFEARVRTGQTGAAWMLKTWSALEALSPRERAWWIACELRERSQGDDPVHSWRPAVTPKVARGEARPAPLATAALDLRFFSLSPEAPLELAERLFTDDGLAAIPIEDEDGALLGVLQPQDAARWRSDHGVLAQGRVRDALCDRPLVCIAPTSSAAAAAARLAEARQPCAVIVSGTQLLGVVFADRLARLLRGEPERPEPASPREARAC